jgi:large subunit ribosomal protein L32
MPQEPKRRHSIARKGKRRSSIHLTVRGSVICKNCQARHIPHTICPNCGYYRGKQVVNIKSPASTAETGTAQNT